MQDIQYIKQKKGIGYHVQSGVGQRGWTQQGARAATSQSEYQGSLTDEMYYATVAVHDPLWRYIVRHYVKEVYGENLATVNILGYSALPVAIELSQWSYPITFLTDKPQEIARAKRDYERQAGFVKNNICFNYEKNIPNATVACFIGQLDRIHSDRDLYNRIDLYLRRCEELVCAVKNNRDWGRVLDGRYDFSIYPYPSGKTVLLAIKEYEH